MKPLTKEIFNDGIRNAGKICIHGHVSPDGDCVGSVLAVYNYIRNVRAGEDVTVQCYLDDVNSKFDFLEGCSLISNDSNDGKSYELAIACDTADEKRLGKFDKYFKGAEKTFLIDHHYTNTGFGDYCLIDGNASSACEVLFGLLEEKYFDRKTAECIYTGLVHDTGVFRYSSTSSYTLAIAGKCIDQGISFGEIIEESFFSMSYEQKIMLGHVLSQMKLRAEGRIAYSYVTMETRKAFHAEDMDMDGMIDQIRTTTGAMMAAYMYETKDGRVKVSLRSNSDLVDVSRVCVKNNGGGHKKAAGCFMSKDFEKNMDEIEADFREQIENAAN